MSEKISQRTENADIKASDFDKKLNELKFDGKELKNEMYAVLARSNGYSLIRGEIVNKEDASMDSINVWDLDAYVEESGGDQFLKDIYEKGVAGLKKDFENQKEKLKKNISVLQSDKKDFRTRSFKESLFAAKILEVAAASNVGVEDLTFEKAFNHNLFSDSLRPTLKGVAEYGLTWFEYKNRNTRKAALKRKQQSEDVSGGTTDRKLEKVDYKLKVEPKGHEVMVKIPKLPKVENEGESLDSQVRSAKEELRDIGVVYMNEIIKETYQKSDFKVEIFNNGSSLRVMDGERAIISINIVRDNYKVFFTCNMRNFDLMKGAMDEAMVRIKRYVNTKEHERLITQDEKDAREKEESKEWFSKAEEFVLSVNGIDDIKIIKDSHGFTRFFGKDTVKTNVIITVDRHIFYGELNFDKKSLIMRVPIVLSSKDTNKSGVNAIHEFESVSLGDLADKDKLLEDLKKLPGKYHTVEQKMIETISSQSL